MGFRNFHFLSSDSHKVIVSLCEGLPLKAVVKGWPGVLFWQEVHLLPSCNIKRCSDNQLKELFNNGTQEGKSRSHSNGKINGSVTKTQFDHKADASEQY